MDKQITIRMPKKLLAKWLKALRSGNYQQGQDMMEYRGAYCCLGVMQMEADGAISPQEDGTELPCRSWMQHAGVEFFCRRGLSCDDPYLPSLNITASGANDQSIPFAAIADAIEACAEGY